MGLPIGVRYVEKNLMSNIVKRQKDESPHVVELKNTPKQIRVNLQKNVVIKNGHKAKKERYQVG